MKLPKVAKEDLEEGAFYAFGAPGDNVDDLLLGCVSGGRFTAWVEPIPIEMLNGVFHGPIELEG